MRRRKYVLLALVVLAIPAGWFGYLALVAGTSREPARKRAVENYQRIVRAQYDYHKETGAFPGGIAADKTVGLSWRVALLPHLGEIALYGEFKLDEPWDSEHNKKLIERMPKVFASPGKPAPPGHTFVRSTQGPGGMLFRVIDGKLTSPVETGTPIRGREVGRYNNISDGTVNTVMFLEAGEAVPWTKPDELTVPFWSVEYKKETYKLPPLGGVFEGGFHAMMVDGTVRFFKTSCPEDVLLPFLTPSGGETAFPERHAKDIAYSVELPPPALPEIWNQGY